MTPTPPVPADNLANKAIVAAVGTIVTVLLRWAVSGHFTLNDEGLVALAGAITTVAVYAVSNARSILRRPRDESGQGLIELVIAVLVILILVFVLLRLV